MTTNKDMHNIQTYSLHIDQNKFKVIFHKKLKTIDNFQTDHINFLTTQ